MGLSKVTVILPSAGVTSPKWWGCPYEIRNWHFEDFIVSATTPKQDTAEQEHKKRFHFKISHKTRQDRISFVCPSSGMNAGGAILGEFESQDPFVDFLMKGFGH